jgi:hypothetical protein
MAFNVPNTVGSLASEEARDLQNHAASARV